MEKGKAMRTQSPRVVRTGPKVPKKKNNKPQSTGTKAVKTVLGSIGKIFLTTMLVLVITGCIVGTALTIYLVQYINTADPIKIDQVDLSFTTYIYGVDKNGEYQEIEQLNPNGEKRTWVSFKDIPQNMKDAIVAVEDERFLEHDGVDYRRLASAIINLVKVKLLHIDEDAYGASTITQQLIKCINEDFYDRQGDYSNKIKEILEAMTLERHYTKPLILEAYLNIISLGNNVHGVQAGAQYYFGKDVSELTLAECASLAVITKSPSYNNPLDGAERNKERRGYCLDKMLELGNITQAEYDEAKAEELNVKKQSTDAGTTEKKPHIYSYFVDAVYNEVVEDLMAKYSLSKEDAANQLKSKGYKVYTTQNIEAQQRMQALFQDPATFAIDGLSEDEIPQAAMVIMDPKNGNVVALMGGWGEKTESLAFNRATMAEQRAFGSTIKPLSVYAPAFEQNLIYWSELINDAPKKYKDPDDELGRVVDEKPLKEGETRPENYDPKQDLNWPNNFNKKYQGVGTIIDALKVSKNTIAVELCDLMGIENSYSFLKDKLGFKNLGTLDQIGLDALALGSAGTTLEELTAGYQIFANGGYYTEPKLYTKVVDSSGKIILDTSTRPTKQVLTSETAYIMNRALWQVVNGGATPTYGNPSGSGASAVTKAGWETVGKTGTSMDRKDLLFLGCTPYYVAGIRYGHDLNEMISDKIVSNHIQVWAKVMQSVLEGYNPAKFELDDTGVVEQEYCTVSGLLATDACQSKATGYYKEMGGLPDVCHVCGDPDPASSENEAGTAFGESSDVNVPPFDDNGEWLNP